jgi:aquaporin Z
MQKLIVEGIGTFFLVFTVGMVVIAPGADAFAPIAIGFALMVMVYAGGHVSGAHYNPAVTLGVFLRGKATAADLIAYPIAQVLGAVLASMAVGYLKGGFPDPGPAPAAGPALLAEFLATFALVFVILNVATARATAGNSYFGLAIGCTVMAMAYAVGGISGGAFNPAVAIGITVMGLSAPGAIWIFLLANFAGGAAAALLFNALDLGGDRAA